MIFIYITCPNKDEAKSIAQALVQEKLAACANIFPGINSIYQWEGKLCDDLEAVLILKTQDELFEKVEARVKELHSYDCPCIVAIPLSKITKPYEDWIASSLRSSQ